MEPLRKIALVVLAQRDLRGRAVNGLDFDIAAVEGRIDPDVVHLRNLYFYCLAIIAGKSLEQGGGDRLGVCRTAGKG